MNINRKAMKQISGNTLKSIAAFTMLIDHFAAIVIKGYVNGVYAELTPEQFGRWETAYNIMRGMGRTSFPLFAFLLVEGFFYTKNRRDYGRRLILFALLSELPFDLAVKGSWWNGELQNGLFTLFFGFVTLCMLEACRMRAQNREDTGLLWQILQLPVVAAACGIAHAFRLDYGYFGILLIAVFYYLHLEPLSAAIGGFAIFAWKSIWCFPAFGLIPFYSGKRGSGQTRHRYGYYILFPAHLLLYALIRSVWLNS